MKRLLLIAACVLLFSACGVINADGTCRNYEPLDFCDTAQEYVCETTHDGCRHCTCQTRGTMGGQWGEERRP